jgi:hypothetical protein
VLDSPVEISELVVPLYLGLAVVFWLAGFDIIYSLQDREFDRAQGLYSVPVRFGVARALQISSLCHLATIIFLALVGFSAHMQIIYWLGLSAVIAAGGGRPNRTGGVAFRFSGAGGGFGCSKVTSIAVSAGGTRDRWVDIHHSASAARACTSNARVSADGDRRPERSEKLETARS